MHETERYIKISDIACAFAGNPSGIFSYLYLYDADPSKRKAAASCLACVFSAVRPGSSVARLNGESLLNEFLDNFLSDYRFYEKYFECDLLLFEDVEQVAGSELLMEKLYVILDARLERRLPFAVFAETPPSGLKRIAPRLLTVFEGALVLEAGPASRPACEAKERR